MDERGFAPRVSNIRDMADYLLADRGETPVGKCWATNFINRQPELKRRYSRTYDYQRAKCEDPEVIEGWFRLIQNTIIKYGIVDEDIYNFDETGFSMGIITSMMVVTAAERRGRPKTKQPGNREWATVIQGANSGGWTIPPFIILAGKMHIQAWYEQTTLPPDWIIAVSENGWTNDGLGQKWIQHFDQYTRSRTKGSYRLLILDGHGSHITPLFDHFCEQNDIITLCMPAHSSHLLQPLDVSCFSPLKTSYGRQIDGLIRLGITHIDKVEFLNAFHSAHQQALTESNIKSGFAAAGIVPLDQSRVLSGLSIKPRTPTPQLPEGLPEGLWTPKTPQNPTELKRQSTMLINRIVRYPNSSPTKTIDALNQLVKGCAMVMHGSALLRRENTQLRAENTRQKKKKASRKRYIQEGGILAVRDGQNQVDQTAIEQQIGREMVEESSRRSPSRVRKRAPKRCRICKQEGHTIRRCPIRSASS
jgi:hypothetical protein